MSTDNIDLPSLDEASANQILDDIVTRTFALTDEEGNPKQMTTTETLVAVFGAQAAPVVAQLIFQGAVTGFEKGLVAATPGSDRTDVLVRALRQVHKPEMFGDCEEDGDHYPCRTARALTLVSGSDPNLPSWDDELKSL